MASLISGPGELVRLAAQLDAVKRRGHASPVDQHPAIDPRGPDALDLAARAKRLYDDRRRRTAVFGNNADLFGEPGWDILLDLFMAWAEMRTVRIGDACIAAAVPKTTALRWLETLAQRNLLERTSDRSDARSSIVGLTARGVALMRGYLAQIP